MSEIENLIIHEPCGLPVELCECPSARVKYDAERDVFVDSQDTPPPSPDSKETT